MFFMRRTPNATDLCSFSQVIAVLVESFISDVLNEARRIPRLYFDAVDASPVRATERLSSETEQTAF